MLSLQLAGFCMALASVIIFFNNKWVNLKHFAASTLRFFFFSLWPFLLHLFAFSVFLPISFVFLIWTLLFKSWFHLTSDITWMDVSTWRGRGRWHHWYYWHFWDRLMPQIRTDVPTSSWPAGQFSPHCWCCCGPVGESAHLAFTKIAKLPVWVCCQVRGLSRVMGTLFLEGEFVIEYFFYFNAVLWHCKMSQNLDNKAKAICKVGYH